MSQSKRSDYYKTKHLLSGLRDIISALPTEVEKQEIQTSFNILIEFLMNMQKNFGMLPSVEDTNEVSRAIQKLEELYVKAEANPTLASTMGLNRSPRIRRTKAKIMPEEITQAKTTLDNLEELPTDQIRSKLQSENYPLSELRAIASVMGIRSIEKLSRDALAHQITMKIANRRGYQILRGQPEEQSNT